MDLANLPPAGELIAAARAAMQADGPEAASKALDEYAPGIDQYVNTQGAAEFMGYADAGTVRRMRRRKRADGTAEWPAPDQEFGWQERHYGPGPKWAVWKLRTIVLARAEAPGRGHPGRAGNREDWHATHVKPASLP
jgi:hypothetical protein